MDETRRCAGENARFKLKCDMSEGWNGAEVGDRILPMHHRDGHRNYIGHGYTPNTSYGRRVREYLSRARIRLEEREYGKPSGRYRGRSSVEKAKRRRVAR